MFEGDKQLIFLSINPQLAYFKKLWKVPTSKQNENLYTLSRVNNVNWQCVIENILDSDANIDEEIITNKNVDIVNIILSWVNKGNSCISNKWLDFLKARPNEIINWIELNSKFSSTLTD